MSVQANTALDSKVPAGDLADKWSQHRFDLKLVNPSNRRKFKVIVVGTGLAGASAAATLGELGYRAVAQVVPPLHARVRRVRVLRVAQRHVHVWLFTEQQRP